MWAFYITHNQTRARAHTHTRTYTHRVELLWTSVQQHKKRTSFLQWDSNQRAQLSSGWRPTGRRNTKCHLHYANGITEVVLQYLATETQRKHEKQQSWLVVSQSRFEPAKYQLCRSQWPRGLRPESAADGLMGLRVRIPPGAWMFVSCECCVLSG